MTYRPLISEVITELRAVQDRHGDLECAGYIGYVKGDDDDDQPDVAVEYVADADGPVCLVIVAEAS